MPLFKKSANVKPVSQLSRKTYDAEIRAFRRIVPDATEKQAREAITSRRRRGLAIDTNASPAEKSKFRDDFGQRSTASSRGVINRLYEKRAAQVEARRGDSEDQVRTDGRTFRNAINNLYRNLSPDEIEELNMTQAEYWRLYREMMGYV
jgi:hypothetical protein